MSKVVGFDFGTTNSVMSVVVGERCIPLLEDGMPHPSVVSYQGNQVIVGKKAKEKLETAGAGVIGNIVRSPKTMLGNDQVTVDGYSYSPRKVVADVVRYVQADARRQMQEDKFDQAVVTVPIDMNGARRRELREACRLAGLRITQFVHEPLAALYGFLRTGKDFQAKWRELNRKLILVFDWGGGTLDLTLCRVMDGMLVQLMNDGCSDVGGDVVDDMVVREIERLVLKERGIETEIGHQIGARPRLRTAAENAKVQLSSRDVHPILVTDYFLKQAGSPDIAFRLNRRQLEASVSEVIDRGIRRIHQILDRARIDPMSIELCLATGGMVNMPMIQSRLNEIFGPQRVRVSDRGNTIISEGAAWIAHDGARLTLAKNVEVAVARQAYFPVLRAGTPMPREGEVQRQELSMYCVDPRDGIAKFQLCAPKRTGRSVQVTDERDVLGVLSVFVDKEAMYFQERLILDLRIDDNLILHAKAASEISPDSDAIEIHGLDFGLAVPRGDSEDTRAEEGNGGRMEEVPVAGKVLLRFNVCHEERKGELDLVPGELVRKFNDRYFDPERRTPIPEYQKREKLYYQACAHCQKVRCECPPLRESQQSGPGEERAAP